MKRYEKMSRLYAPTLKEDPVEAELASHRLLLRAGMIRKTAAGLYSYLPLAWRSIRKIEAVIRDEMEAIGAQEMMVPILTPAELWHESGRWDAYGPELMRISDRHDRAFALGPTHEETFTDLVKNELRSYKQLPCTLYQIQDKFRDEMRPRFGLMRGREFIMKDAYSFDADEEGLEKSYQLMREAYSNMCERMGLEYRIVQADSGQIGGSGSEEFMALAETGEAELVHCQCGYAADVEAAACKAHPVAYPATQLENISTPGVHTIAELAAHLGCSEAACMKAFAGKDEQGGIWVLFVPGDYEVNEVKAENLIPGFTALTDDEMKDAGLVKGSMGPVGLPAGVKVAADESLREMPCWVVGANEDGFHYVGAQLGRDFQVDAWADLCLVREGDPCPVCGLPLSHARGIEVGQIFKLGDKYSRSMDVKFMDENGAERYFIMGCYGVGVTRTLAAAVEQSHDDDGIVWPFGIAPAHICVIPLATGDDVVQPAAERLAAEAAKLGFEVAIDDRKERAGVKFADADLIGWPLQVIVGKRGLAEGKVEIKRRRTGERREVELSVLAELFTYAERARRSGRSQNVFDVLFK